MNAKHASLYGVLAAGVVLAVALAHHFGPKAPTKYPTNGSGGGGVVTEAPATVATPPLSTSGTGTSTNFVVPIVASPPPVVRHYGPCATRAMVQSAVEDVWLRDVLKAPDTGWDPTFGRPVYGLEAAECAARRWRLEGR
jgi:hypothetical protein